jgi:serine/threonine protein kinase
MKSEEESQSLEELVQSKSDAIAKQYFMKSIKYFALGAQQTEAAMVKPEAVTNHVQVLGGAAIDTWTRHWCQHMLGTTLWALGMETEAQEAFQHAVEEGFYLSHRGLADIELDHQNKAKAIEHLIKAAEQGFAEAWEALTAFVEDEYLLQVWSVEKIVILQDLMIQQETDDDVESQSIRHEGSSQDISHCLICKHQQSGHRLQSGINRDMQLLPCDHIEQSQVALLCDSKIDNFGNTQQQVQGTGGQGEVIFAELMTKSGSFDRKVALKRFHGNENNILSLEGELCHLKLFRKSDYVVQCLGHTKIQNEVYLVMEGAPYGDLNTILLQPSVRSYLNSSSGLHLIYQWIDGILRGIYHMHRVFVQHCDIKPHNVLVFDGLHVKLADLGLSRKAKHVNSDFNESEGFMNKVVLPHKIQSISGSSSSSNMMIGTLQYMAPELRMGGSVTWQSDMFSFGMTCVHIINQESPTIQFSPFVQKAKTNLLSKYHAHDHDHMVSSLIDMLSGCVAIQLNVRLTAENCLQILDALKNFVHKDDDKLSSIIASLKK